MRKSIAKLAAAASLLLAFSVASAFATCQTINLQNQRGAFTGQLCVTTGTTETGITLDGTAYAAATDTTYTVDAQATISGTEGNYTVSGTVTVSDGTNTKTWTFSCPGTTTVTASATFVNNTLNRTFSLKKLPTPIAPATPLPAPSPETPPAS